MERHKGSEHSIGELQTKSLKDRMKRPGVWGVSIYIVYIKDIIILTQEVQKPNFAHW